eukprot:54196-Prorocentrum_minimum.AAC.1
MAAWIPTHRPHHRRRAAELAVRVDGGQPGREHEVLEDHLRHGIYSHDGPIRRRRCQYVLATDEAAYDERVDGVRSKSSKITCAAWAPAVAATRPPTKQPPAKSAAAVCPPQSRPRSACDGSPAPDWSIVRIYPRILCPIGPL